MGLQKDGMMQKRQNELKLPTISTKKQIENRDAWNEPRLAKRADFFTVGYSGRTIEQFLDALKAAGVSCLIDIRANPVSMYKPDFSKNNLERHLSAEGISYLHLRELGVPRDIRSKAIGKTDRNDIWDWYDEHVASLFGARNLHRFFNLTEHPVAFMCSELDPTCCHRHRLALALEKSGLNGLDA